MRKQEEVGLRSATDGEFRRASWHMDFIYQLDGVTKEAGHIAVTCVFLRKPPHGDQTSVAGPWQGGCACSGLGQGCGA